MNGKDEKDKNIENESSVHEENENEGSITISEEIFDEQTDLQKIADQLGNEHAQSKSRKFFGRKNKDDEFKKKIEQLNDKLKEKDEKIKELENNLKLMVAENRNQKIRIENEFRSKIRFASEEFFRDFIIVKDDFDKAMDFIPQNESSEKDPFIQGIRHLHSKTENIMKKHGLECFSGIGEIFDPSIHQAMSMIAVEGKSANEIVAEYMKGYKLHNRILRPSMVVVASGENPVTENVNEVITDNNTDADDSEKPEKENESENADDDNIEQ